MQGNVIIVYRFPLETHLIKSVEVEYNPETKLVELCKEYQEGCRYLTFSRYYSQSQRDMMTFGRVFPYIWKEDSIEWNAPYAEVTVEDFIRTHAIENHEIHVEINGVAGWSSNLFSMAAQSWLVIKPILEIFGYGLTVREIILWVFRVFGKKKERIPGVESFRSFILTRDCWDVKELGEHLQTTDPLTFQIIEAFGYEEHDGLYWKNAWKVHQYEDLYKGKKLFYVGTDEGPYDYLEDKLADINLNLMYLNALDDSDGKKVYYKATESLMEFVINNPNITYNKFKEKCEISKDNLNDNEEAELDLMLQKVNELLLVKIDEISEGFSS